MASNETTAPATSQSFQPDYLLNREEEDGSSHAAAAPYPPLVVTHHSRTDTEDDGTNDESSGGETTACSPGSGLERPHRRSGRAACREAIVERAWEMRRSESPVSTGCRLVVRPGRGRSSKRRMKMDLEEVKACKDLGLALPRDWTYEISAVDRPRSACTSPVRGSTGTISEPGGDPGDVKAKLKVWAHAVAAASASRLSS